MSRLSHPKSRKGCLGVDDWRMKPHTPGPRVDLPGQLEIGETLLEHKARNGSPPPAPTRLELAARKPQKACDLGLFSSDADQLDLVEMARKS